jgi:hypothetical protein
VARPINIGEMRLAAQITVRARTLNLHRRKTTVGVLCADKHTIYSEIRKMTSRLMMKEAPYMVCSCVESLVNAGTLVGLCNALSGRERMRCSAKDAEGTQRRSKTL